MKPTEIIEALKEFFLDILGYLIPGIFAFSLIISSFDIDLKSYLLKAEIDTPLVYIIISYCLGYVVYGLAMLRDQFIEKWLKKVETPNKISAKVKGSVQYKISVEALKSLWSKSSLIAPDKQDDVETFDMREVRSAVMAYIPEMDTKIYTFMFRSELCNHLNMLLLAYVILGLIAKLTIHLFSCYPGIEWIPDGNLIVFFCAFLVSILLHKARMRFLSITYKIPFTIFIAKYYPISINENAAKT